MCKKSPIIWFTGMSGSGKSTLSELLKKVLNDKGYSVSIIDGDYIRDNNEKLGFGFDDVYINNIRISSICNKQRKEFDIILVPVISPYNVIREEIRRILEPNFHLVYLQTNISSLKDRDPKGLYAAADQGKINDLIGYSKVNTYDEPHDPELIISTTSSVSPQASFNALMNYINKVVFINGSNT
jgi:adenylylsulfate kinase